MNSGGGDRPIGPNGRLRRLRHEMAHLRLADAAANGVTVRRRLTIHGRLVIQLSYTSNLIETRNL